MKDRPILFSGTMVRAILEGQKTQTRRIVKPQGTTIEPMVYPNGSPGWRTNVAHPNGPTTALTCPYGVVGDRLRVKETTWRSGGYVATDPAPFVNAGKKPAIHCSRMWSRILLEVTDLRVERVQSIIHQDAVAEGIVPVGIPADEDGPGRIGWTVYPDDGKSALSVSSQREYEKLWDAINGKKAPWASNPFVWCITFRRVD